jgi:hypothetical protein
LIALPPERLEQVPLVKLNLLCAQALAEMTAPDLERYQSTIASWADRVMSETSRHWYRFQRNPSEFENSEAFFRMLILSVVLAEDFRIHYREDRKAAPGEAFMDDGFFADPTAVFISGLLGPSRSGTCSSLPVLYVAIGRQLGYPLKLGTTRGHLFVRWEDSRERFNVEATSHGLCRFDDEYYRHWPFEVGPAEEAAEGYLTSLTPVKEVALFLSIRGMCLREARRYAEAHEAFVVAARLDPNCKSYRLMASRLNALGRHEEAPEPNTPQRHSRMTINPSRTHEETSPNLAAARTGA